MNQAPAKKKGLSTTAIVLIVVGVVFLLLLGTCAAAGIWVGHKVKDVKENIAEGGLVLVSPPEVVSELAGPKKDYVGAWRSTSGKSALDIAADGGIHFKQDEGGSKQELTAPIAAFKGDDILVRLGIDFTIAVTQPPKKSGTEWVMIARGITFHRDVTE
ncbi:MAG: hypothetical protein KIT84_00205 [Labilithrix sp.]|nr:hypothetical protein [Labilithrix sp.]MCW5809404.1 hypothetical protein [Labilithrix sp.]